MSAAKPPEHEHERLQALRLTGLLDSPTDERFDRLTRLAAQFFQVETCLITLVDEQRQWFKSSVGLEIKETHRDYSFCAHAILDQSILQISDAREDPRLADNPLVTDAPGIRFYDGLTGLPNRRLLLDRLQQAIMHADRHKGNNALLFIDLDNFKDLNDSAGHDQGDKLLQDVANRLGNAVRKGDTVARLGGDEFIVLLEKLPGECHEAASLVESIAEKLLAALNRSFWLDDKEYRGSASIGVTLFNDQRHSREDLLKQADMAMYKAKAAGRNSIRFFDPEMQTAVSHRAALEQDLHEAIQQQQFRLHYQAQVDQQGQTTGAEVLLRWQHPQRGMVSPADFIPLTEDTGLIVPIGAWVLEQACQTLAHWANDPGSAELSLAVNISVVQFRRGNLVAQLQQTLQHTGANPHRLKLEITESLLANNLDEVIDQMSALRQMGVSFSIDDFGTGYSSLFYLKQLPINQLKIDQRFVRDLLDNQNDQAIAEAIITLARAMQLDVIAEGVETAEQQQKLQQLGCHHYQGYLFGRPQPLEDFQATPPP